jgi:hypothetical protein
MSHCQYFCFVFFSVTLEVTEGEEGGEKT